MTLGVRLAPATVKAARAEETVPEAVDLVDVEPVESDGAVDGPGLTIADLVAQAARRHGVEPAELLAVAQCESGLRPGAYNPVSSAAGLFQFLPDTWLVASRAAGWAGASPYDPIAAADVGGYWYARHPEAWRQCRGAWR